MRDSTHWNRVYLRELQAAKKQVLAIDKEGLLRDLDAKIAVVEKGLGLPGSVVVDADPSRLEKKLKDAMEQRGYTDPACKRVESSPTGGLSRPVFK